MGKLAIEAIQDLGGEERALEVVLSTTYAQGGNVRKSATAMGISFPRFKDLTETLGARNVPCRSGCGPFEAEFQGGHWIGDCPVCGKPNRPKAAGRVQFRMQLRAETLRILSGGDSPEELVAGRAKARQIVEAVTHKGLIDLVLSDVHLGEVDPSTYQQSESLGEPTDGDNEVDDQVTVYEQVEEYEW